MTDLDDKLRRFLDDNEEARHKGVTLERVHELTTKLANAHAAHESKCDMRWEKNADIHASMGARVTTIEARMVSLVDASEITGEHAVDAIREAAEAKGMARAKAHPLRRAHDHPWWRRALDTTVAKVVLLAATGAVSWLLGHLAGGGH